MNLSASNAIILLTEIWSTTVAHPLTDTMKQIVRLMLYLVTAIVWLVSLLQPAALHVFLTSSSLTQLACSVRIYFKIVQHAQFLYVCHVSQVLFWMHLVVVSHVLLSVFLVIYSILIAPVVKTGITWLPIWAVRFVTLLVRLATRVITAWVVSVQGFNGWETVSIVNFKSTSSVVVALFVMIRWQVVILVATTLYAHNVMLATILTQTPHNVKNVQM